MGRSGLDFKLLFEAVPGLYLVLAVDSELTILGASDAYLRATMTVRDQIVGRPLFDVFPDNPADPEATGMRNLADSIARAIATRSPDTMAVQKYDVRRPDGEFEQRWWSPVNTPVSDETGTIRYIIHRVEDVTELVVARREGVALEARIATEQRRADLRFRDLVDLAPDGVIACDASGTILVVNVAAERMFKYSRTELVGKSVEILIPERVRSHHAGHIAAFVAAPSSRPMGSALQLMGRCKDGSEFPVEISLSPMRGENGLTISTAIRDISDRRTMERDLQRLAAIVASSEDAIIAEDLDAIVTSWNPAAEQIFGYSAKEMIGESMENVMLDGGLE
ncbi:MAG TPA: PAS domain S-box protein, partial [Kofleriaceae bacterium]